MKPPSASFLTELADLYRCDATPQDIAAGCVPNDLLIALAEPCSMQRTRVIRDTSGAATIQFTTYALFFARDTGLTLDDLVVIGTARLRVTGMLDAFEVVAEG